MKIDRSTPSSRSTARTSDAVPAKPTSTGLSSTSSTDRPRDPGKKQAARERFVATATAPVTEKTSTSPTKVTRAFVQQQAAEGVLTGTEAARALDMGASAAQVLKWSAGETVSESAAKVLVAKDLAPLPGADPGAAFSAGGRDYASAKDYVRFQAAEGVLTAAEVRVALQRGAKPEQIEAWATGQTISDNGRAVLALARSVAGAEPAPTKPKPKPAPTLPSPPSVLPGPVSPPSTPVTPSLPPVATRPTAPPVSALPEPALPPSTPATPPAPSPDVPAPPTGTPGWVVWDDEPDRP